MGLNQKQQAFVDHYFIHNLNAPDAAEAAGYPRHKAYKLIKVPAIQAEIRERLAARRMSADEALDRLMSLARASLADLIVIRRNEDGTEQAHIDLVKAMRNGSIHFIQELDPKKNGYKVKMVDQMKALFKILQVAGLDGGESNEDERDWFEALDEEDNDD